MLDRLKRRLNLTGNEHDALLGDLLEDAEAFVLDYTGRTALPVGLTGAVCELAAASYQLLGLEGVLSHSEGGVSSSVERLPAHMREWLNRWRVARVK